MTPALAVHPDADAEIEEAAVWCEARRVGLGLEFMAAVDRVLQAVAEEAERFPTWRRARMTRLPFVVFVEVEEDRVVVWAVAHTKRRLGYWVARRAPGDAERRSQLTGSSPARVVGGDGVACLLRPWGRRSAP